jgi:A/G-specific adenine glycosylase
MKRFAPRLLDWYRQNKRILPWRDSPDPYAVWVSEIMLQQTRVETVLPYFERWMARFPTVEALAAASQEEVLALWEGLGYYSRARNLHRAANVVVETFGGEIPSETRALRSLPGIGRYTAAAIASMAFGLDEPTLDGNIRRVFSRLFALPAPSEKELWALAEKHLPHGNAGDFNQALMDLGATICTPRVPACAQCPISAFCDAYRAGTPEDFPRRKAKKKVPHHLLAAAVVIREEKVLLAKRPSRGLLGGLWEFPNARVESLPEEALPAALSAEYGLSLRVVSPLMVVRHAYTHFRVTVHAFRCISEDDIPKLESFAWVEKTALDSYPMGKVARSIAREVTRG